MSNLDPTAELEKAIFQAIKYDPYLAELATGGVYWGAAPDSAKYPGIVMDLVAGDEKDGRTLGNGQLDVTFLYSFSAYADGSNARQRVLAILKRIHEVMNDWRGDDDVDVYDCKRESFGRPQDVAYITGIAIIGGTAMYEIRVRTT